jgi:transcriptional regulator with XRE-family HTH domain
MAAAQGDPPAVARQRVRRALRRFRGATPLSQGDVATKLGWSLSKMQRIEAGEVSVSTTDLRALLVVYEVADERQIEKLTADARASRRQRYETSPEYRAHLTPSLLELIQFEKRATSIRTYQPLSFPGVLQTPTVAEAILAAWRRSLDAEARRVRYNVRMDRRRHLVERPDGPEFFLILDESVIKRRIVNAKVTAEQLEDIAIAARQPRMHVRLVPFVAGDFTPALGAFQILRLGDDDEDAVLYREMNLRDELVHDPQEVEFYSRTFEELWQQSLGEAATLRAINAESAALRSSLDYDEVSWRSNQT